MRLFEATYDRLGRTTGRPFNWEPLDRMAKAIRKLDFSVFGKAQPPQSENGAVVDTQALAQERKAAQRWLSLLKDKPQAQLLGAIFERLVEEGGNNRSEAIKQVADQWLGNRAEHRDAARIANLRLAALAFPELEARLGPEREIAEKAVQDRIKMLLRSMQGLHYTTDEYETYGIMDRQTARQVLDHLHRAYDLRTEANKTGDFSQIEEETGHGYSIFRNTIGKFLTVHPVELASWHEKVGVGQGAASPALLR